MRDQDTSLGGLGRNFPQTTWGLVQSLIDVEEDVQNSHGLEKLFNRYWKPIYRFIRAGWSKSNEETKDLTQDFFVYLTEKKVLRQYLPEKGTLRTFLKVLLRQFLSHYERDRKRLKRGGDMRKLSIDFDDGWAEHLPDDKAKKPEDLFDQTWKAEVIKEAIEGLRQSLKAKNKPKQMKILDAYILADPDDRATYEELGKELGIGKTGIRNKIYSIREKLRGEIRARLADTVATTDELDEEYRALFGS